MVTAPAISPNPKPYESVASGPKPAVRESNRPTPTIAA